MDGRGTRGGVAPYRAQRHGLAVAEGRVVAKRQRRATRAFHGRGTRYARYALPPHADHAARTRRSRDAFAVPFRRSHSAGRGAPDALAVMQPAQHRCAACVGGCGAACLRSFRLCLPARWSRLRKMGLGHHGVPTKVPTPIEAQKCSAQAYRWPTWPWSGCSRLSFTPLHDRRASRSRVQPNASSVQQSPMFSLKHVTHGT